jgi:cytochrome c oxidase subunit IV
MTVVGLRSLRVLQWSLVALLLAGGVVWAVFRGVHWYGLTLAGLYYDVDQPPVLVFVVGVWFAVRVWRTRP